MLLGTHLVLVVKSMAMDGGCVQATVHIKGPTSHLHQRLSFRRVVLTDEVQPSRKVHIAFMPLPLGRSELIASIKPQTRVVAQEA